MQVTRKFNISVSKAELECLTNLLAVASKSEIFTVDEIYWALEKRLLAVGAIAGIDEVHRDDGEVYLNWDSESLSQTSGEIHKKKLWDYKHNLSWDLAIGHLHRAGIYLNSFIGEPIENDALSDAMGLQEKLMDAYDHLLKEHGTDPLHHEAESAIQARFEGALNELSSRMAEPGVYDPSRMVGTIQNNWKT